MSVYANDPRVKVHELDAGHSIETAGCVLVDCADGRRRSVVQDVDHWLIGDADGRVLSLSPESFNTADDAIRSLIGDPR